LGLFVANRLDDPNNHDNVIGVFLESGMPSGDWTVRIHGRNVQPGSGIFHAWIERDDESQSSFGSHRIDSHTLGSISCGRLSIVAGSYDAHKAATPLSFFSSAGPTRDGRAKPEISAPGHDVFAAHSRTEIGTIRKSGTSMAAPAVSGIVALILGEASRRKLNLTNEEVCTILQMSARRTPPEGAGWHERYGNGRVSAMAAIQRVIDLAGQPTASVPTTTEPARGKPAGKAKAKRQG
jgi:hypothetical protein